MPGENIDTREFKKPRQRCRGQPRLENEFIFHYEFCDTLKVIHCQNYQETESGTQR